MTMVQTIFTVLMKMRVPTMTTVPTVTNAHNDHGMVPIMPMIEVPTKNSDMFDMLPTVICVWKIKALKRFPIRKQYNTYGLSTREVWEQIKCTSPLAGMKRTVVMDHVICSVIMVLWLWSNIPLYEHIVLHFQSQSLLSWFLHLNINTNVF